MILPNQNNEISIIPVKVSGISCILPKGTIERSLLARQTLPKMEFDVRTKKMKYVGKEEIETPLYTSISKTEISIGLPAILYLVKNNKENIRIKFTEFSPKRLPLNMAWEIPDGIKNAPKFRVNGKERYYFHEAVEACRKNAFGTIKLATGAGKTEIELTVAYNQSNYIGRGLIVVPTLSIRDQTLKRATELYKMDIIEYKEACELLDRGVPLDAIPKIIIGLPISMLGDIEHKKYQELTNSFSWIIGDECHRFGCDTWNKVVMSFPNIVRCHGFSALPVDPNTKYADSFIQIEHKDAMTIAAAGDVIYEKTAKELEEFLNLPILVNFHYQWTNYPSEIRDLLDWNKLCKEMLTNEDRNSVIASIFNLLSNLSYNSISYVSRKALGEQILKHCDEKTLCWYGGDTFITSENSVINKLKNFKQDNLKECFGDKYKSILASSHAIEGIDFSCPLNALILTEGKSERQGLQKVGRIIRPSSRKSLIINFYDDNIKILKSQAKSRRDNAIKEFHCQSIDVYTINDLSALINNLTYDKI